MECALPPSSFCAKIEGNGAQMKPPEYLFTRETKETRATTVNFNPFRAFTLAFQLDSRARVWSTFPIVCYFVIYLFIYFSKYFSKISIYRDDRKKKNIEIDFQDR